MTRLAFRPMALTQQFGSVRSNSGHVVDMAATQDDPFRKSRLLDVIANRR